MPSPSPYRSLPVERRVALVTAAIKSNRERRLLYIQRLASLKGGFRAVTLQSWPADKLARELVRRNAETNQDEFDLLHFMYVEHEPEVQVSFLDAAGVTHEHGVIAGHLEEPYADAEAVRRAAAAVREKHGAEGERYLRTIARYSRESWPGIEQLVEGSGD
ncbi:MAG: hypothetical protein ACYC3Q_05200 [Gemmatimonadaceae bacterium]